jgi:hypothetical protein
LHAATVETAAVQGLKRSDHNLLSNIGFRHDPS